jgi:hypothetical protein
MKYFATSVLLLIVSFGLGLAIEQFLSNKTMTIKLLWTFVPTVTLLIYTSFLGAMLLHKLPSLFSVRNNLTQLIIKSRTSHRNVKLLAQKFWQIMVIDPFVRD